MFAHGEVFVVHKRFDIPHKKLIVAVKAHTGEPLAFRYCLQLEKNGGKQIALLSNVVHSQGEDLEQIVVTGGCIRVDFDMLMHFVKGTRIMRIVPTSK
jgi:hypothetical protein